MIIWNDIIDLMISECVEFCFKRPSSHLRHYVCFLALFLISLENTFSELKNYDFKRSVSDIGITMVLYNEDNHSILFSPNIH